MVFWLLYSANNSKEDAFYATSVAIFSWNNSLQHSNKIIFFGSHSLSLKRFETLIFEMFRSTVSAPKRTKAGRFQIARRKNFTYRHLNGWIIFPPIKSSQSLRWLFRRKSKRKHHWVNCQMVKRRKRRRRKFRKKKRHWQKRKE